MRFRTNGSIGLAVGYLLAALSASAQGNTEDGAKLAEERCIECHDVAAGGVFKEYPPSFAAIAVYRSREQIRGRIQYPPQHARMPQLAYILNRQEVADLVDYIVSLDETQAD